MNENWARAPPHVTHAIATAHSFPGRIGKGKRERSKFSAKAGPFKSDARGLGLGSSPRIVFHPVQRSQRSSKPGASQRSDRHARARMDSASASGTPEMRLLGDYPPRSGSHRWRWRATGAIAGHETERVTSARYGGPRPSGSRSERKRVSDACSGIQRLAERLSRLLSDPGMLPTLDNSPSRTTRG